MIQTIISRTDRTVRTFPAVDMGPLLPGEVGGHPGGPAEPSALRNAIGIEGASCRASYYTPLSGPRQSVGACEMQHSPVVPPFGATSRRGVGRGPFPGPKPIFRKPLKS